jgi:hypothetical protein
MLRLVSVALLLAVGIAAPAPAGPLRGVVRGDEPPAGVTVLDRRGDLWLVTGSEEALAAIPGAVILGNEPDAPAAPARVFIPAPTPVIDDLVAQVDAADLMAEVEWIVGLGVRSSQSTNIPVVADSLEAKLASYGLATEQHWFPLGSQGTLLVPNVVATQTGRVQPDSVFVICAHYDATSENARYDTPGADDNASGTVGVLTAARLLAGHAVDYTVQYVLFAGEEQGMVGSDYWVADQAAAGVPIVGALNFDMIAWWTPGVPYDLEIETNRASRWLADAVVYAATQFTQMPFELHVDDAAWWGDFYSFWQHGYHAVNHEESWDWGDPDFNPYYHTTLDTPDKLSPDFFVGSVRIGVASLALLARAANVSAVPAAPGAPAALAASPNPFNGKVSLRLTAAGGDGPQPVEVYDLRGRRVGSVAIALSGGRGEAVWDARDGAGRVLPAGVYLARAEGLPGRPSCRMTYVP